MNDSEVRDVFIDFRVDHSNEPLTFLGAEEAFDNWLVEHDRAVAEKAWERGAYEGINLSVGFIGIDAIEQANPFSQNRVGPISVSHGNDTSKDADA